MIELYADFMLIVGSIAFCFHSHSHTHTHSPHRPAVSAHLPTPQQRESLLIHQLADGSPADKDCITCTAVLGVIEQYAWDSKQSLSAAASAWCTDVTVELPTLAASCDSLLDQIVIKAEPDFGNHVSPDITCRNTLLKCNGTAASCTLFPTWPPPPHSMDAPRLGIRESMSIAEQHNHYAQVIGKFLNIHILSEEMIKSKLGEVSASGILTDVPLPSPDLDSDRYSAIFSYRGLQWRGKDCDDISKDIYPGKNVFNGSDPDAFLDSNCNGIAGVDSASGKTYEELYCENYPSRGILAIGDSATAHFSLPPSMITPAGFSNTTYKGLLAELISESDWPQCSWSTAWANNTECPYTSLNISSIYQRMLERNRCGHRDYVNAGVNGASVRDLNTSGQLLAYPERYRVDGYVDRDRNHYAHTSCMGQVLILGCCNCTLSDIVSLFLLVLVPSPSTVFFSMIGNDICGSDQSYTPADVFLQKATAEFHYLDTLLAPGSHVIIMGLVDGRVLYDTLQNAIHPVGTPYPAFYNYLNCLQISPCFGWMNSNSTIRDQSTAQAMLLNEQYATIMKTEKFNNFDLHYFWPDYASIIKNWVNAGHNPLDLIEPVDGFHPSQTGNMLIAASMWDYLSANVVSTHLLC
jgi:acyloxyacyl hydrolase